MIFTYMVISFRWSKILDMNELQKDIFGSLCKSLERKKIIKVYNNQ